MAEQPAQRIIDTHAGDADVIEAARKARQLITAIMEVERGPRHDPELDLILTEIANTILSAGSHEAMFKAIIAQVATLAGIAGAAIELAPELASFDTPKKEGRAWFFQRLDALGLTY